MENTATTDVAAFTSTLKKYECSSASPEQSSLRRSSRINTTLERPPKRAASRSSLEAHTDCNALTASSGITTATKRKRTSSKYVAPSHYAHLPPLVDILEPNLICVFVGVNPGITTSQRGHAYAHPSNLFWKLLYSSGCTDRRCAPEEDRDLPRLYSMGNTNIVKRPTKDQAELSKEEMVAGTSELEAKFQELRPESVCIVGKGIWEAIWRSRYKRAIAKSEFHYGWQDVKENMGKCDQEVDGGWKGARVYVACSTSGLSASLRPPEKEAIWKPFGEWVKKRREERQHIDSTPSRHL